MYGGLARQKRGVSGNWSLGNWWPAECAQACHFPEVVAYDLRWVMLSCVGLGCVGLGWIVT